jgi:hypothetical protein
MYVCIDQNCGVTTEGGEEEEANISLLFYPLREERERERKPLYGQIFFSPLRRKKGREQGESDIASIRGMCIYIISTIDWLLELNVVNC